MKNANNKTASEKHLAIVATWQPANCPAELRVGRGRCGSAFGVQFAKYGAGTDTWREVFSGSVVECQAFIAGVVFEKS